ncbi:MAG: hypothetical protein M3178_03925 [Pseudomonadota bacterium]|nr:hypothetical protein [Pseudomonadota bacterium]
METRGIFRAIKGFVLKKAPKPVPAEDGVAVVALDEMRHTLKKSPAKSGSGRLIVLVKDSFLMENAGIVIGPR